MKTIIQPVNELEVFVTELHSQIELDLVGYRSSRKVTKLLKKGFFRGYEFYELRLWSVANITTSYVRRLERQWDFFKRNKETVESELQVRPWNSLYNEMIDATRTPHNLLQLFQKEMRRVAKRFVGEGKLPAHVALSEATKSFQQRDPTYGKLR